MLISTLNFKRFKIPKLFKYSNNYIHGILCLKTILKSVNNSKQFVNGLTLKNHFRLS
jgi:hypothetical protein